MEHLRRDQLRDLLEVARAHRERDFVWILVGFWHGLRISEIVRGESRMKGIEGQMIRVTRHGLTPANFRDGYLDVQRLKGSLRTVQRLHPDRDRYFDEKTAVESWIAHHRKMHGREADRSPLFPIGRKEGWKLMRLYARRAEIPEHLAHPHILKHSMGMLAVREGIEYARQRLGHKSIASTGHYLKVSDPETDDAIERRFNLPDDFYRPSKIPIAASGSPPDRGGGAGMSDHPTREELAALRSLLAKFERSGGDLDPAGIFDQVSSPDANFMHSVGIKFG